MAFKSKDGKRNFGNRQQASAYDERSAQPKTSPGEPAEHAEPDADDISGMDIHEAVAAHGPADHIEMEHEHEAGHHTVTSHHGGKKHHSEHASAKEAHEHAMRAAGEEPMGMEEPEAAVSMGNVAGHKESIPGM